MFFSALRAPLFALGAYVTGVLAVSAVYNATYDLSTTHDLARAGAGDYYIKLSNLPTQVDTGGIPKDLHPNVEDLASIKLSRDLAVAHPVHEFKFRGCGRKQRNILLAIDASRRYIARTERYLRTQGTGDEYQHWFGIPNRARITQVHKVFTNLKDYDLWGYTFDCTSTEPSPPISLLPREKRILLRTDFLDLPPDGVNQSQAILIIASLSTLEQYGPLQVLAGGWKESVKLASKAPDDAIWNLDGYMEFIVAVNQLEIAE